MQLSRPDRAADLQRSNFNQSRLNALEQIGPFALSEDREVQVKEELLSFDESLRNLVKPVSAVRSNLFVW